MTNFIKIAAFCCFYLALSSVYAQNSPPIATDQATKKTTSSTIPTPIRDRFGISGIRLGVELSTPILGNIQGFPTGMEFYGELMLLNRVFIVGELGQQKYMRTGRVIPFDYQSNGNYWRAGIEYNILHLRTRYDAFFVGFRYGMATFDQQLQMSVENPYWQEASTKVTLYEANQATWIEGVLGFKSRLFNNFYTSLTVRIKQRRNADFVTVAPESIPGFGHLDADGMRFGMDWHLTYKIPFKKQAIFQNKNN